MLQYWFEAFCIVVVMLLCFIITCYIRRDNVALDVALTCCDNGVMKLRRCYAIELVH